MRSHSFVLFSIVLHALCLPTMAFAQTEFIHNDDVVITLPEGIHTEDCEESLALKAGGGCLRIARDGAEGVLFYRQSAGYALMAAPALEKHILDSVSALSDIPNIHVRDSRILPSSSLLGMIDLVRSDAAVAEITGLAHPPISQTSILIPLPQQLGQLFIYLSSEEEAAQQLREDLVAQAPQAIRVLAKAPAPPQEPAPSVTPPPEGTLALLPRALLFGGAAALFIILLLHLSSQLRKKSRSEEDT